LAAQTKASAMPVLPLKEFALGENRCPVIGPQAIDPDHRGIADSFGYIGIGFVAWHGILV
jgi:hypothetical protein